jgi:hypothetical protein
MTLRKTPKIVAIADHSKSPHPRPAPLLAAGLILDTQPLLVAVSLTDISTRLCRLAVTSQGYPRELAT